MFLELQIGILERFLKDRVTLKTGVMMLKIHRNVCVYTVYVCVYCIQIQTNLKE